MKSILQYIKDLFTKEFETEFEPSKEDVFVLEHIDEVPKLEAPVQEENIESQYDLNIARLLKIYEEVDIILKEIEDSRRLNLKEVDYEVSDTYQELITEPSKVKISFLYFILKLIKKPPKKVFSHFHKQFLSHIFNSIVDTRLNLSSKDFEKFILFENKNEFYYQDSANDYSFEPIAACLHNFSIDESLVLQKLAVYSYKKKLTETTLKHLKEEYFLNRHPSVEGTFYNAKSIYRIFTNTKYVDNKIPFFLLPDDFGKKVNQLLLNSDETKAVLFSEFLKLTASNKKLNSRQHRLIENIGLDFFRDISIQIVDLVAGYNPNVRLLSFGKNNKQEYTKYYNRMFEENITIVFRLLVILEGLVLASKLSASTLITIIERSSTHKNNADFLGTGAVKIGNECIKILASGFVENGVEELKTLSDRTKYKNLKKKIAKELSE